MLKSQQQDLETVGHISVMIKSRKKSRDTSCCLLAFGKLPSSYALLGPSLRLAAAALD